MSKILVVILFVVAAVLLAQPVKADLLQTCSPSFGTVQQDWTPVFSWPEVWGGFLGYLRLGQNVKFTGNFFHNGYTMNVEVIAFGGTVRGWVGSCQATGPLCDMCDNE